MRKTWDLEATDLSIHSQSPTASRGLKGGASPNNKQMKSWNCLLQDTEMDAKNNCKSGDRFTLKYYSISISTWGSPEITADGEQTCKQITTCLPCPCTLTYKSSVGLCQGKNIEPEGSSTRYSDC